MRRFLLLFLCLAIFAPIQAQSLLARSELGLSGGGMNYLGDLNDQTMFGQVSLAGGLTARINIDSRWAVAACGSYGHVKGGNPDVVSLRNLSFRSHIVEGCLRAEFNFFPYGVRMATQKRFTPYLFCGIGLFGFNPQAHYGDTAGTPLWYDLQPLGTEGQGTTVYPDRKRYQLVEICMPFGLGIRYRLTPGMHFTAEYGWRKTWTDYLDDVSTTYVGADLLTSAEGAGDLAAALADRSGEVQPGYVNAVGIKRGDDSLDDWYAYFNVSVTISAEILFGWMRGKTCEH